LDDLEASPDFPEEDEPEPELAQTMGIMGLPPEELDDAAWDMPPG